MWKSAVVLLSMLAFATAWVGIANLEPKPEKFKDVEGCYFAELDKVIPYGASIPGAPSKGCYQYKCAKDIVNIEGCVSRGPSLNIGLVQIVNQPFPVCCDIENPVDRLCVSSGNTELCNSP